jgi:hypothetical protein
MHISASIAVRMQIAEQRPQERSIEQLTLSCASIDW